MPAKRPLSDTHLHAKAIKLHVAVVLCLPFWYLHDREPQPGQLHVVHADECRSSASLLVLYPFPAAKIITLHIRLHVVFTPQPPLVYTPPIDINIRILHISRRARLLVKRDLAADQLRTSPISHIGDRTLTFLESPLLSSPIPDLRTNLLSCQLDTRGLAVLVALRSPTSSVSAA